MPRLKVGGAKGAQRVDLSHVTRLHVDASALGSLLERMPCARHLYREHGSMNVLTLIYALHAA